MINTYKESSLHKTLKELYALNENAQTEVHSDGHIYDILTEKGNVIEIQTLNLGKLLPKIQDALSKGRKCKIVHPVIVKKTIETYDKNGNLIKKTGSPKKENEYTLLKDITGIYPLLLKKNFCLEVPFIKMTEKRIKTEKPEQSENGRRRFKKDWQKSDKKLNEIIETKTFSCKEDYTKLLPEGLPETFCAKDIATLLKNDKTKPKNAYLHANLIAWLFLRMDIFEQTEKKGRTKIYKIKNKDKSPENYGKFVKA